MNKILLIYLTLFLSFLVSSSLSAQSFGSSNLSGENLNNPTSIQFGPDGRLYVSQQNGFIFAYTVVRDGNNDYRITNTETISNVKDIQNHNDDGQPNNGETNREVTGLLVTGTAANPVLYVSSSDFRIGGGGGGSDVNLDTNSGIISRLTRSGNGWNKVDLVRGLPRSEENHASNGLQLDETTNTLFVAQGGHTNAGAPSNNFAFTTEYALSAAVLSIDLDAINNMSVKNDNGSAYIYDIPTLDDPTRPNVNGQDINDPFGGNDGLNQAKIVPGGPVQVYSPGFRNIFDLVLTEAGRLYTWDNGANAGWGGHPASEGGGNATNNWIQGEPGSNGPGPNDPQVNNEDGLHFITGPNYYGGHPNPIRANPSGAGLFTHDQSNGSGGGAGVWRTNNTNNINTTLPSDWPPVPTNMANPIEGDFQNPGDDDGSLITVNSSTNGMVEYTASNFGGAMQGDLLAASFSDVIYRVNLNNSGSINNNSALSVLASGFGNNPLDVTAQGDNDIFPGTVWLAGFGTDAIVILEPTDFQENGGGNNGGNNGGGTATGTPIDGTLYINSGGPTVTTGGITWLSDRFNQGSNFTFTNATAIAGTTNDVIYQTERSGRLTSPFSYAIPVDNGTYDVELHFAEIFAGTQNPGQRVFDVMIEGNTVLNNYDIAATAGYKVANVQTRTVDVTDGTLNINFSNEVNNPKISGIVVIPDGQGPPPPATCQGNPGNIDEDGDGFTNSDEIANGTSPCNGADRPSDFDGTMIGGFLVSDLNDPDDDDDGIPDTSDKFALDPSNGLSTSLPINYPFLNGDPGFGFFGLGFTGLMTNGNTDYLNLIQDENNSSTEIIAGGAVGLLTFNGVPAGDAYRGQNNQQNGYQFGINVNSNTNTFAIEAGIVGPVFLGTPSANQAVGVFLGNGDQDNYLKFTVYAAGGNPGFQVLYETGGNTTQTNFPIQGIANQAEIAMKLIVNPSNGTVQPQYAFGNGGFSNVGTPIQLNGATLSALQANNQALAVGVISTTSNSNPNFNATWDFLNINFENGPTAPTTTPATLAAPNNVTINNTTDIITVNHTGGNQPITVQNISINNNNFAFNSFSGTPFTLNQGQSFDLEISHTGGNNQSAQLTIAHNGSNGPSSTINLNSGAGVPSGPSSNAFIPDPGKIYHIDAPHWNTRLASTGQSEDPYTTTTNQTGADVEWRFVAKGNGFWHVQRAAGGAKPRLRTDATIFADMQETTSSGSYTYYELTPSNAINNTYFFTLPDGPTNFKRLQVLSNGNITFVGDNSNGTWESLRITEVATNAGGNGGNTGTTGTNTGLNTGAGTGAAGCTVHNTNNFGNGFGIWNDGGSDCALQDWPGSNSNASVRLRDNSGVASSVFTDNINFSNAGSLTVSFDFYPQSMENGEDFFLEYSTNGGSSWSVAQSWVSGTDFTNDQPQSESVSINGSFSTQTRLRFRCDATANADLIFIDNVVIESCGNAGGNNGGTTPTTACNGSITGFSLNPQGGAALINLSQGQTFCSTDFANSQIRIRANENGSHESLLFTITTPQVNGTNKEEFETYDSFAFDATTPGTYTVMAQLYSAPNLGGSLCDQQTISFVVENCGGGNNGGDCFTEFDYRSFESSFGIWNDGGSDCARIQNNGNAANGSDYYIRLRDNSGVASSMFTDQLPFNNVSDLRVDFVYFPNSMEAGEDFFLEYSTNDGNSWSVAQSWVSGVDFTNGQFYNESVTINGNFSNTTRLRIRCDASGNGDQVYIDNVIINICGSAGLSGDSDVTSAVRSTGNNNILVDLSDEATEDAESLDLRQSEMVELRVYPNPVSQESDFNLYVNLSDYSGKEVQVALVDINGKQVLFADLDADHSKVESLDLSELMSGMYILYLKADTVQNTIVEKIILSQN